MSMETIIKYLKIMRVSKENDYLGAMSNDYLNVQLNSF